MGKYYPLLSIVEAFRVAHHQNLAGGKDQPLASQNVGEGDRFAALIDCNAPAFSAYKTRTIFWSSKVQRGRPVKRFAARLVSNARAHPMGGT